MPLKFRITGFDPRTKLIVEDEVEAADLDDALRIAREKQLIAARVIPLDFDSPPPPRDHDKPGRR